MDLTGYKIIEYDGTHRRELTGAFNPNQLAALFIEEWIRYTECGRSCGRSDYCKYVQPYPDCPDRLKDIKCGVVVDVLTNLVRSTFDLLLNATPQQIQNYLDGAFYLSCFVYDAEQIIGMCMNQEVITWFGEYAPGAFGRAVHLREKLNLLGGALGELPAFHSQRAVLFVEGTSEKAFLNTLQESQLGWFLFLLVEEYGGKGSRRLKRIKMLLDKYKRQGYKLFMQGDADGRSTDIFQSLIKKGTIAKNRTFVFRHDFETAVPAGLLLDALHDLGQLGGISLPDFAQNAYSEDRSVIAIIYDHYDLNIEPMKVDLARAVGARLNGPLRAWWQDAAFMETELGRFLRFLQRAR